MIVGPGRPAKGYGKGMLSASELAGRYGDSEGLLRWADDLRREGKSPFVERDRAAETGTAVHAALVAHMTGDALSAWALDDTPDPLAAGCAYDAGVRWLARERADGWRPVVAEEPIADESIGLAGTPDLVCERGPHERLLVDWKTRSPLTSGGNPRDTLLVDSHVLQIGAYCMLLRGVGMPCSEARIVYLPRLAGYDASVIPVDVELAESMARTFLAMCHALDAEVRRLRDWGRPKRILEPLDLVDDEPSFAIEDM